jgi:steroid delta-isomerase
MSTRDRIDQQLSGVPSTIARSHIEDVTTRFMATYAVRDVDTRISLFADDATFEDPAGLRFANNAVELRQFFAAIADSFTINFEHEKLIVAGDEALQIARVQVQEGDSEPVHLHLFLHFVFNSDGLITSLRTFFDQGCVS